MIPTVRIVAVLSLLSFDAASLSASLRPPPRSRVTTDSAIRVSGRFPADVVEWLEEERVPWTEEIPGVVPSAPSTTATMIGLPIGRGGNDDDDDDDGMRAILILHLIKTPTSLRECLRPNGNREVTDFLIAERLRRSCAASGNGGDGDRAANGVVVEKIIHLHEDVWNAKTDIAKHRILANVGRSGRRIFARKTESKRIDAASAARFLEEHHLWGSTKAKHCYGLFELPAGKGKGWDETNDDSANLVAVATFSARRKIIRQGAVHRSHELLRLCSRRDATVVGGVSKLLNRFIVDRSPDDIVTVVDRDWGDGGGWRTNGFITVDLMSPLVMAVNPRDGIRRHLVGAGIRPDTGESGSDENIIGSRAGGRLGLPSDVLELLRSSTSYDEAEKLMADCNFFPVYDSGVERLFKVVTDRHPCHAEELWNNSSPRYAASYYSSNPGVSHLLERCESANSLGE